jgi:hypothetical protein
MMVCFGLDLTMLVGLAVVKLLVSTGWLWAYYSSAEQQIAVNNCSLFVYLIPEWRELILVEKLW